MNKKRLYDLIHSYRNIIAVFSVMFTSLYPILYIYFLNAERVKIFQLVNVTGLFLLHAIIFIILGYIIYKNILKASLFTNLCMFFIQSFGQIEKVIIIYIPALYYWQIVFITLTLLIMLLGIIRTRISNEVSWKINIFFLLEFLGLMLFNGIKAIPTLINKFEKTSTNSQSEVITIKSNSISNVYYIIFDEYGGYYNLINYCGYDNSDFYTEMEDLGFNVSMDSYGGGIMTETEIANRLNLRNVVNNDMTYETIASSLKNPYIYQLFRSNGYRINAMIDQSIPLAKEDADIYFDKFEGVGGNETATDLIIQNSIYYPILSQGKNARVEKVKEMFQYMANSPNNLTMKQFTFGYFMFPHLPWVVDENGNRINSSDYDNWSDSNIYLGQLKYTSKKIIDLSKQLVEADPESIIIIQSDHGFRQPSNIEGKYSDAQKIYQQNILNVVYYKGEFFDIESLSGINTLITVLNKELEINIHLVESEK